MRKLLILMSLLFFGNYLLHAQKKQVSGTVSTSEDGSTLPGVTVVVKGTTIGSITDNNGKFLMDVPTNATTIVFSYVGMKTVEVAIENKSVIEVVLEPDVVGLDEVVVTALGIKREKKALNYSSQTVKTESLNSASQISVTNALQGRVAGVSVSQSSGMPGSSSYITIRGATHLTGNNQPLYVVDGMPVESGAIFTEPLDVDRVSGSDASSRALDINTEDIESLEVLKGPVASALYGLRASNGVILITTKSGKGLKSGEGMISFTTSYTMDKVSRLPELQDKYAQGVGGVLNLGNSRSYGPLISDLGEYVNIQGETVTGKLYDNVSPFFRTGGTYTANLALSRATENASIDASLGYTDQKGMIPTTGLSRYTGKISGEYKVHKKISAGGSAMFSSMNVDKLAGGSNLSNPLFTLYYAPRSYDLWGTAYAHADNPYKQYCYRAAMDNPRWTLAHNSFNERNDRIIGNAHIEYKPFDFLSLRYQVGVDNIGNHQKEIYELGSGETGGRTNTPSGGQITDFAYLQREVNSNFLATISKTIGKVGINAVFGNEIYDYYERDFTIVGQGFDIGGYHNVGNTASQFPTENIGRKRTVGFYNSTELSYASMIFVTGTIRNDIVSNLAAGNRSFLYPSIGTSFVFTEMMPDLKKVLSFGKIRASYAAVGQAYDDPYPIQNIYLVGGSSNGGFLQDGLLFPFNDLNGFTHSNILRSPDLSPQNTITFELGTDLKFFQNRIGIDYTYFNSRVKDQIFRVPLPQSTGYNFELRNAGEVQSIGHEIMLHLEPVRLSNLVWTFETNFTRYENKVIKLAPGVSDIYLGGFSTPSIRALEGQTYPSIFGIGYLRDDAGNIVLLDEPGNPYHGMPITDPNAKWIGDVQPDFIVGFNNTINFKGFQVSALVDWKQGGHMYSGNNRLGCMYGALKVTEDRTSTVVLDGVKGYLDDNGDLVVNGKNDIEIVRDKPYWDEVLNPLDEAWVYETTYVRFREFSVSWTIPQGWIKSTPFKNLNVSVVGRNLALWTKYPNFDPETSTTGATNGQGIEYVAFPQSRSFGAKLSVNF